jgi:hypothetical protein
MAEARMTLTAKATAEMSQQTNGGQEDNITEAGNGFHQNSKAVQQLKTQQSAREKR